MKKLLIVDDEVDLVELVVYYLKDLPLKITTAHSGNSAIEILKKEKFDLILSDLRMVNGTGLDLYHYIEGISPRPKFIFLTAFSDAEIDELVMSSGVLLFNKPIDFPSLKKALMEL